MQENIGEFVFNSGIGKGFLTMTQISDSEKKFDKFYIKKRLQGKEKAIKVKYRYRMTLDLMY